MDEYLTWNDIKRFINGYFGQVLILNSYMDSLFKNQYCEKKYNLEIKNMYEKSLEQFPDFPIDLKNINGYVSLFQEEDGPHFRLDANLFIQSIMRVCEIKQIDMNEYFSLADKYYNGNKDEFINRVKEILKEIKSYCNLKLKEEGKIIIKNHLGQVGVIKKDAIIERRHIITWLSKNLENIIDNYELEVTDDILSNISQDKLLLLITQYAFNESGLTKTNSTLDTSYFPFIQNYCRYIKYRRLQDSAFNPKYIVKNKTYSQHTGILDSSKVLDFVNKFNLKKEEYSFDKFGYQTDKEMLENCLTDLNEKVLIQKKTNENKERLESFKKDIECCWEFIPKQEAFKKTAKILSKNYKTDIEKRKIQEKKERLLEEKLDLFKDLPYIATLRGYNHFDGYMAYVFLNGKVIFEKFYNKTRNGLEPVIDEAIYVMSLEYFQELSKKSKTDIREFIKEGIDSNAKVIYHFKNFKNKVLKEVENIEYNEEVLDYIESLVSSLSKNKELKK